MEAKEKPRFYTVRGKGIEFSDIMEMFRGLAGREPTEEEERQAREAWEKPSNTTPPSPSAPAS